MIRPALRLLYTACGALAAVSLALIALLTIAQIIARQLGIPLETTELSGFALAASTFLGLAYSFVNGDQVRVGLTGAIASARIRRGLEIWCCAVGLGLTLYAAWQVALFAHDSFTYGDLSPGMMAVPLWLPQSTLVIGLVVMAIGFVEQLAVLVTGGMPDYLANEKQMGD